MKLIMASDYSAFNLKEAVRKYLEAAGHSIDDVGQTRAEEQIPYIDAACNLARKIVSGKYDKGLLFCGSGAGVSIVANKFKGVYCVPCESMYTARGAGIINDANVISMGANVIGPDNACRMADLFLEQTFCKGMPADRRAWLTPLLERVKEVEAENMK